jgi:hypothetical protein
MTTRYCAGAGGNSVVVKQYGLHIRRVRDNGEDGVAPDRCGAWRIECLCARGD